MTGLGQDVSVNMYNNGQLVGAITDVRHFEVTSKLEILNEGFLGERTERKDNVFKGIEGRLEVQSEDGQVLDLVQLLVNRAMSRNPGIVINIDALLQYPGGALRHVQIQDAYFGEVPMNFGGRTEYGTWSFTFAASLYQTI